MTDGIGVDIAVMATAMEELGVTGPFDLHMPMDMATGMGPGITAPQASMFKLDFDLSDHLVMSSSFLMSQSKSFIKLPWPEIS
jgi:hypothetical protein